MTRFRRTHLQPRAKRITRAVTAALAGAALTLTALVAAPAAGAAKAPAVTRPIGFTAVTTAPGIASTLIKAGVLPLPVVPQTKVSLSLAHGLAVNYFFPITSSTANLTKGTGDILHTGGINFVSRKAKLEIGKFDIDLAAGKIFATQVNYAPARIPVLDLDLSGLKVGKFLHNSTALTGIKVKLDPVAAGALNKTFGLGLPTNGSLLFGTALVVLV